MKNNDIQFILTKKMTDILLEISHLKYELSLLEEQMNNYKNTIYFHNLTNSKNIIEKKIKNLTKKFIKEFRKENMFEIELYNLIKKGIE